MSDEAPLPEDNDAYSPVRAPAQSGLQITTRQLLHAVGSKLAALPATAHDECLKASLLFTFILDLSGPHLCFKPNIDSDLQTPRSQEMGIGMMCLLAEECFDIPWDQLGSLPGPGMRF